ncbi:MAG: hypothetical protein J2P46_08565 [Zavarzinella sp.]|nr:hypothetical protein [Zavarzinella sp.]
MSRAQARAVLTRTAVEIARDQLARPEFRDVDQATVSVVSVTSTNEYGDTDLRTLRKYGLLRFRRDPGGDVRLVSARVAFDPAEEADVYRRARSAAVARAPVDGPRKAFVERPPEALEPTATEVPHTHSEQVLFDEVDLYDHPEHVGDRYPAFAPERVRRNNCDYYLVSDPSRAAPGSAGPRFGEVVLRAEAGSVIYLPRALSYRGAAGLAFSYRKSTPRARVMLAVHLGTDRRAVLLEGQHPSFTMASDTEWHRVTVPLAAFVAKSVPPPAVTGPAAPAWHHLEYHEVAAGEVFALELGLWEAAPNATLYFDRIALIRAGAPSRELRGAVNPPVPDLTVEVNSPTSRYTTVADSLGNFRFELPLGVTRYEVIARHQGVTYQPAQGRYFDAGGYLTPVSLNLRNEPPAAFKARKKSVQYYWDKTGCGIKYRPREHLLHCVFETMPQEYFTENATNGLGFFDRDRRPENPSGAFRIVLTGECFTEGSQVDSQERLAAQLESILRFRYDRPIEVAAVINPMMSLTQAWPSLESIILPLNPDLVLIPIVASNQIPSLYREFDAWRWGYHPDHPRSSFFERDRKTGGLRVVPYDPNWNLYVSNPWDRKPDAYYKSYGGVDWEKDPFRVDPAGRPPFLTETVGLLAGSLRQFRDAAQKHGARVALLDCTFLEDRKWVEGGVAYDTRRFHALLEEAGRGAGIAVLDGTRVLKAQTVRRASAKGGYIHSWEHNGHWSPAGHRFVAEGVAAELAARGLLGPITQ